MHPKAEILFPYTLIPRLHDLRGPQWSALVDRVSALPETHPDNLAFCLLMIRMDGCLKCYSGSYKFMRGCEACAIQSIMQFKGDEDELLKAYELARSELLAYQESGRVPVEGNA